MANRRQGGGGGGPAFDSGYNRRPGGQGQQFGSPFETGNQRQNNFETQFIPRDKSGNNYFGNNNSGGGGSRQDSGRNNNYNGGGTGGAGNIRNLFDRSDDFGSSNLNPFVLDRSSNRSGRDDFNDRGGVTNWRTRTPSPQRGSGNQGSNRDDWNRMPQSFDGPSRSGNNINNAGRNNLGMSGMGMNNMGNQSSGQPVVMVMPQANNNGAGLMGVLPVQATPNPFVQRQQPMQVILGNLPAFNADAIGQQILAAASARPQYGQGIMNAPQGGLMNQQNVPRNPQFQQSQQRFDGGNQNNSGQYSHQNKNSPLQRNSALRRRSEPVSGSNNKSFNQGNRSATTTTVMRGNRKRVILRDRFGPTEEVDKKRPRTSLPAGRNANNANKGKPKPLMGKKKDEKKPAVGTPAKKQNDKTADEKVKAEADETKKEDTEETKEGEETGEKKPSKFEEIPTSLLVCKICQKSMNDASSYESHLSGRAHLALVKILEERFKKRAELLMFESKITEEEIGIEKERQRRAGKSTQTGKGSKNFCKMCDCNYYANWGTHKVSIGHRLLKEFLHPNCKECSSNFVHRLDWVNHLLSAGHLKKMAELKEKGVDIEDSESTSQEELFVVNIEIGKDDKPTSFFKIRSADFKAPSKEELKEMLKAENGKFILPEGEIEVPKEYEEDKAYGEEAILKLDGACCKVCRIYLASPEEAETHVKSKPHYGMYVSFLKKIIALREHKKAEEEKAVQLAAEKEKAEAEKSAEVKEDVKAEGGEEVKVDAGKDVSMEVEEATAVASPAKTATPAKSPVKAENASAAEAVTDTKTEDVKTDEADVGKDAQDKMEEEEGGDEVKTEEMKEETPAKDGAKTDEATPKKAGSPVKASPQTNRGQQRGRGNRGNRGTPTRGHGNRGGRGGMQTPQRGGATPRRGAASNTRGRGNRGGGMDTPSWRGNRGRGSFR